MEILAAFSSFTVGAIAGFFGATVGGGGLLAIPYLMFTGLPPQVAIATARFGDLGGAAALHTFWKGGKIIWKYVPILAALSLVGSLIGANILLTIDPGALQKIAGALLLILLPFVLFKKEIGVIRREVSKQSTVLGGGVYFVIQIFTGFFAAGTGPLVFYTLVTAFGFTIVEAVATQVIPFLILTISSVIIFAMHGLIDYSTGIVVLLGTAVGGYIGARFAVEKGSRWLKVLFIVMVTIAGMKLLFF